MRGNVVLLSLLGTGALFVALAGEVLGRFVFFNMHVLIGL
jgi:DMSO reductase anchor subunit